MPIAPARIARRLIRLGAATLSDAIGKSGGMDHDMKSLSANPKMAGPAYTVRVHTADILAIAQALADCPRGHVLVIDGQGERNTAIWGELTTLEALLKGLAGVVIDGAVRDVAAIRRSKLPVFARGVVPNGGGAEYLGEIGRPIQCGGQVVCPGDWLVGDEDGIVVIRAEQIPHAIAVAGNILAAEKKIERQIRSGASLARLLRTQEAIDQKAHEVFIPQLRVGGQR